MAKPKRTDKAAIARRERDRLNYERKKLEAAAAAEAAAKAADPDQLPLPEVKPDPPPAEPPAPEVKPEPPPPPPPVEPPPVVKLAPAPNLPPPDVKVPRAAAASGDWRAEFGAGTNDDGRRDTCVAVAEAWQGILGLMVDSLKSVDVDPLIDPMTTEIKNALVLTVDEVLPDAVKVSPRTKALAATTVTLAQRVYHRKAIKEAEERKAERDGRPAAKVIPIRAEPPPAPPPTNVGELAAEPPTAPAEPPPKGEPLEVKKPKRPSFDEGEGF